MSNNTFLLLLTLYLISANFQGCFTSAYLYQSSSGNTLIRNRDGFNTMVFPLRGGLKQGHYFVDLEIGSPSKTFDFQVDSGSDITWVQCDENCKNCPLPKEKLYKPPANSFVTCNDILCKNLGDEHNCSDPNHRCEFKVEYADDSSAKGLLVKDYFSFTVKSTGKVIKQSLALGCGNDLQGITKDDSAGILGLGNTKASILYQLRILNKIRNIFGHCLGKTQGSYLFFGDSPAGNSTMHEIPITKNSAGFYLANPADLYYGENTTDIKNQFVIFDSGSTITYFPTKAYKYVLDKIRADLVGKPLEENSKVKPHLCWSGIKDPIKSVDDIKGYYTTLALSFTKAGNVTLQLTPQYYLLMSGTNLVCFGIEEHEDREILIGGVSMRDQIFVFDNEKNKIRWRSEDCSKLPSS